DSKTEADSTYKIILKNKSKFSTILNNSSSVEGSLTIGKLEWIQPTVISVDYIDNFTKLGIGEISEPLRTKLGWSIIILNNKIIDHDRKSYAIMKNILAKEMVLMDVEAHKNAYSIFFEKILKSNNFEVNLSNINNLINSYAKSLKSLQTSEIDPLNSLKTGIRNSILATSTKYTLTVKDIEESLKRINLEYRNHLDNSDNLIKYIKNRFENFYLRRMADELGYTTRKDIVAQGKINTLDELKNYYTIKYIVPLLPEISDEEYKKYYDRNKSTFTSDGSLKSIDQVKGHIKYYIEEPRIEKLLNLFNSYLLSKYNTQVNNLIIESLFRASIDTRK
ncbi:MAG: hypothetical protein GQ534_05875, partial [Candidatus Delongbacteria bacterium]|nr:hypothetical protein [Candidatus Delongbacteria bacterium]